MQYAEQHNLNIPLDFALTGFDDIEDIRYQLSPLTTVVQPAFEQARLSMDLIMQKLEGHTTPDVITLPSRPVIRQSCGCLINVYSEKHETVQTAGKTETLTRKEQSVIVKQVTGEMRGNFPLPEKEIARICRLFLETLAGSIPHDEQGNLF